MAGAQSAQNACRVDCLEFMATHLVRAFYDTSHHVRASVCACFTLCLLKIGPGLVKESSLGAFQCWQQRVAGTELALTFRV